MISYTVHVAGDMCRVAQDSGYHAYYAGGVTAIEIKAYSKDKAQVIAHNMGCRVLYVFI